MLLQTPEAGPSALERRKLALIEEIEAAALAEPPVFGIDTQIRAGVLLAGKDDVHAERFLRDAGQRTLLLGDAATRGHFLKRIVHALTPLDPALAESFCTAQSRMDSASRADPLAQCYDQLIARLQSWSARKDAFERALAAGAYNLPGLESVLNEARDQHRADFLPLLNSFVAAFPQSHPHLEEIERLESVDRKFAYAYPALTRQVRRLSAAARREYAAALGSAAGLPPASNLKPEPAALGGSAEDPADASKSDARGVPFFIRLPSLLEIEDPQLEHLPQISGLSVEESIALAERQSYPGARAAILADILDEKDAELDPRRKMSLAEEVLRDSRKMRLSSVRLIVQAELARWFHQRGEVQKAGEAAVALQSSFDSLVQCRDLSCEVFGANVDHSPGELIMMFAEYLKKYGIDPGDMGLNHPGLRARWLLLELDALIEGNNS
jgi:hypothetical protein